MGWSAASQADAVLPWLLLLPGRTPLVPRSHPLRLPLPVPTLAQLWSGPVGGKERSCMVHV